MEKFLILGSPYQNPGKRTHGIQFTPTAQTAIHVGKIVKCIHCLKARVVYAKKQLSDARQKMMKPMLNYFQYVCGTVFYDLPIDDKKKKTQCYTVGKTYHMNHLWKLLITPAKYLKTFASSVGGLGI